MYLELGAWGPTLSVLLFVIHLLVVGQPRIALWTALSITALGVIVDSIQHGFGLLTFNEMMGPVAPLWLTALWLGFASMFTGALHWITAYPKAAALSGAILGPWSYWSASWLGALEMTMLGLFSVGLFWAVLMYVASKVIRQTMPELSSRDHSKSELPLTQQT